MEGGGNVRMGKKGHRLRSWIELEKTDRESARGDRMRS